MSPSPAELLNAISDPHYRTSLDPLNMMGLVLRFPAQCRQASEIVWHYGPEHSVHHEVRQIVVTGLGGSAIGGDFLRCLADAYGPCPLQVNRDYSLPQWAASSTLTLAASYSGNTEETLAAYAAAGKAGCALAVVTSGGKLAERAQLDGVPYALVPGGQPPRSATGFLFFPAIHYLSTHHYIRHDFEADYIETFNLLEKMALEIGPDVDVEKNPAKQLALALHGKIPIIYGSQGYRGAVAYRWKCQINENSKLPAFSNVLPEQNHNEILAWVQAQTLAPHWAVVMLRDEQEELLTPHMDVRIKATSELIQKAAVLHEVAAQGTSLLARLFTLTYFADFVSVYLAYLTGVCPTDIASIDTLKAALSG